MTMKQPLFLRFLLLICCTIGSLSLHAQSVPVYVWQEWNDSTSEATLQRDFARWKAHGVHGVCFRTDFSVEKATIASRVAHAQGLEFHAWIPCMLQPNLPAHWYAVNRKGERADTIQAYVPYYKCLDPNNPEVQQYLIEKYREIATIPTVDYIQLDYIRYVDVILARGLWDKYGLVMHEEYPAADYCYCDHCVAEFKQKTNIDIRQVKDPARVKAWAKFRCNVITQFVNRLTTAIHAQG